MAVLFLGSTIVDTTQAKDEIDSLDLTLQASSHPNTDMSLPEESRTKPPSLKEKEQAWKRQALKQEVLALQELLSTILRDSNLSKIELFNKASSIALEINDKIVKLFLDFHLGLENLDAWNEQKENLKSIKESIVKNISDHIKTTGDFVILYKSLSLEDINYIFWDFLYTYLNGSFLESQKEMVLEIFDYLYKYSDQYKLIIKKISIVVSTTTKKSTLLSAYDKAELKLFETLLKHGYDPNGIGIYAGNQFFVNNLMGLIYLSSVSLEKCTQTIPYIELLLQYGAIRYSLCKMPATIAKTITDTMPPLDPILIKAHETIMSMPSMLLGLVELKSYALIPSFIPYANDLDIIWGLSKTVLLAYTMFNHAGRLIRPGIHFAMWQDYASDPNILKTLNPENPKMSYAIVLWVFSNDDTTLKASQSLLAAFKARFNTVVSIDNMLQQISAIEKQMLINPFVYQGLRNSLMIPFAQCLLILHRNTLEPLIIRNDPQQVSLAKWAFANLKMVEKLCGQREYEQAQVYRKIIEILPQEIPELDFRNIQPYEGGLVYRKLTTLFTARNTTPLTLSYDREQQRQATIVALLEAMPTAPPMTVHRRRHRK